MSRFFQAFTLLLLIGGRVPAKPVHARALPHTVENTGPVILAFWREPTDIASRNLLFGSGGEAHAPHIQTFVFVKEDLKGSNPKFVVRDGAGVRWKVKLGAEAKPETAAARLVWAAGYYTDEDYYLPEVRVAGLPKRLHRGNEFIAAGGLVRGVRLKRKGRGESKDGDWKWKRDPFSNTRELNGLRALMAVINNWDLKDSNNAIRVEKARDADGNQQQRYIVSDLGASFGTGNLVWPHDRSRGNLAAYTHSKFITQTTAVGVDFADPGRPSILDLINLPNYFERLRLRWIGRHVPRSDARWMGQILARLSPAQIQDAFRAAGYSPAEIEGFAGVVENRIALLNDL